MTHVTILTAADLHRSAKLYDLLAKAVVRHHPDVVALAGDFLDATGESAGKPTTEECEVALAKLPCPEVVFVRGNHEDSAWFTFADRFSQTGREVHLLDGKAFTFGPLVIVGFPCLLGQGDGLFDAVPTDPDRWLPKLVREHGPGSRALWLMHEPPYPSPLAAASGPLSGNVDWRLAIERFSPWLVVFGHDHATPIHRRQWHYREGGTVCVNVGQTAAGPLRYTVIEAAFEGSQPNLPRTMTVTAYPAGQKTTLPAWGKP